MGQNTYIGKDEDAYSALLTKTNINKPPNPQRPKLYTLYKQPRKSLSSQKAPQLCSGSSLASSWG